MLIGLHGFKGCGKDTVCKILQEMRPRVVRLAFADPLKDSIGALLGLERDEIEAFKNDPTVTVSVEGHGCGYIFSQMPFRTFLQRYGTESHRDIFGQDFWLQLTLPGNVDYSGAEVVTVVTDVRFPNEVEWIKKLGGFIVKVDRKESHAQDHASERGLSPDSIFYTIDNNGDLASLAANVRDFAILCGVI